jgi:putative ABC transport system permease protein
MFNYNFQLAMKSLKDRPALTFLTILTIAIGLGFYTTVKTMSYQGGQVPLAHKSENIFLVQMDNREITAEEVAHQSRLVDTTYKDTLNLMAMELPGVNQTFNWFTYGILNVEDENINPIRAMASVTSSAFFTMFEPPFLYGNGWDQITESNAEGVIVISKFMNDKLFGGKNSIGENVRIGTNVLKIIGVLDTWHLTRKFYDRSFGSGRPDNFFIPHTFAMANELPRLAGFDCWAADAAISRSFRLENTERLINSECAWVTFWAEIPDDQIKNYHQQLNNYIEGQKALGRFPREILTYVTNLNDQFTYLNGRDDFMNVFSLISTLFFAVCLLNAVGIILAKFMRRTKEVSLRRALGAKKKTIIAQHVIEVVIIGLLGGLLGIVVAYYGLQGMMNIQLWASDYTRRVEDLQPLYALDFTMITNAFLTGILCTLVTSIYPIWRLCNTPPASQLKSQ